jgi:hypothetical protein
VQFENMTSPESMGGVMQELKGFLGLDPRLPSNQLPLTNYKHQRASRNAVSELPAVLAELWDRLLACRTAGLHGCMHQRSKRMLQSRRAAAAAHTRCLLHSRRVTRLHRLQPGASWAMKRWQYEHLIEMAKAQSFE